MSLASQAGLIAKASARDDFSVLKPASGSDGLVEREVFECLQLHMESQGTDSSYLFCRGGSVWFCHARNEMGTDNAGRAKSRCSFRQLGAGWQLQECLALLVGHSPELEVWPESPPEAIPALASPVARRALLELLLTDESAAVATLPEAAWLVRTWAEDEDLRLMRSSGRVPARSRFGRLVAISAAERTPLRDVRDFEARLGERDVPAVVALRRVGVPGRRRELLDMWQKGAGPEVDRLPAEEREWLLRVGVSRTRLLESASAAERRSWLAAGLLKAVEIETLKDLWTEADEPALASFLRGGVPGGLSLYISCARPSAVQIQQFLSGTESEVFASVMAGNPPDHVEAATEILSSLEQAGALDTIALSALSSVLHQSPAIGLKGPWTRALVRRGVPESVAVALAGGAMPRSVPERPPSLELAADWLSAVPARTLLACVHWAAADPAWRLWWVAMLSLHPEGSGYVPSLQAPYSVETMLWLVAETRDGVSQLSAMSTLARWLSEDGSARPGETEVQELLRACGLRRPEFWAAAVLDQAAPLQADSLLEVDETDLELLCRTGLISLKRVVEAVRAGALERWLRNLLPDVTVDLVSFDRTRLPPLDPPPAWPEELTPWLSELVYQSRFWERWPEAGVPPTMLAWMGTILKASAGGPLIIAVEGAERGERVRIETLALVAGGLPRAVKVEQGALWAGEPEAQKVLDMLTATRSVPALDWLKARLSLWQFLQPLPADLTARELLALLPWLDPATAIQAALSVTGHDPWHERLLTRLLEQAKCCALRGAPPPPPPVLDRWMDWCKRFADVPGWEPWRLAVEAHLSQQTSGGNDGW